MLDSRMFFGKSPARRIHAHLLPVCIRTSSTGPSAGPDEAVPEHEAKRPSRFSTKHSRISTCATFMRKPTGISSSDSKDLKDVQNQQIRKIGGHRPVESPNCGLDRSI